MRNRLIILLITLTVSLSCRAMTCPPVDQIDVNDPPLGWEILLPPKDDQDLNYHFKKAYRTIDFTTPEEGSDFPVPYPYNGQVICDYESCASYSCPFYELISDYYTESPLKSPPWIKTSIFTNTWVCQPTNRDPGVCVFEVS
ncbi:MAG: hypothetical protein V4501_02610 [Pseudomonadota bacterium]